jgi:hypothetical protein
MKQPSLLVVQPAQVIQEKYSCGSCCFLQQEQYDTPTTTTTNTNTTTTTNTHDDTCPLANMVSQLGHHALYFMYACGSNQHGQLRQHKQKQKHDKQDDEDIPQLLESVLCCSHPPVHPLNGATSTGTTSWVDPPMQLVAGGGHSGFVYHHGPVILVGMEPTRTMRNI